MSVNYYIAKNNDYQTLYYSENTRGFVINKNNATKYKNKESANFKMNQFVFADVFVFEDIKENKYSIKNIASKINYKTILKYILSIILIVGICSIIYLY